MTPGSSSITTTQALSVTVAVSAGSGTPTATGSVTLSSGGYTSAATALMSGSATINIPAGSLATGSDTLTASYTPDSNSSSIYNSATGTTSSPVTVTKATPGLTVTPSSSSITTTQALSVTVAVSGTPTPTGTVTLSSGSYTSAATALVSGSAQINIPAGSLATGQRHADGQLHARLQQLLDLDSATGTTSSPVTVTKATPGLTVTPSSSSITTTQALSVTVAVSGTPTPTGTVTLSSGSYTSAATALVSGSAQINIPAGSLATGSDTLTANYSGDSTYNAATGTAPVTVKTAVNPGFTVSGTAVSLAPGATTGNASTITVTPAGGFTGTVTLTAALTSGPTGAQYPPTFSFGSTSSVSIIGTTAGTGTLTISTTAPTSATLKYPKRPGVPWYAAGSATLACLLLLGIPGRRRSWQGMLWNPGIFVALTGSMLACGGGGGGGGGGRHQQSRHHGGNLHHYRDRNVRFNHSEWNGHANCAVANTNSAVRSSEPDDIIIRSATCGAGANPAPGKIQGLLSKAPSLVPVGSSRTSEVISVNIRQGGVQLYGYPGPPSATAHCMWGHNSVLSGGIRS